MLPEIKMPIMAKPKLLSDMFFINYITFNDFTLHHSDAIM
jgi:hypothetical protein